jgi:hypothetical protein
MGARIILSGRMNPFCASLWPIELRLTPRPACLHSPRVTTTAQPPFQQTLRWLATHARFPAQRLPDKAELLVLIATAAATEESNAADKPANAILIKNKTYAAQMRNYTAQRRRAHITCDNSAKT